MFPHCWEPRRGRGLSMNYSERIIFCGSSGKEPACQHRKHKRCESDPWVGKIPLEKEMATTPVFLPGKSHGHRSLVGYSPRGRKESDMTEATLAHTHRVLNWQKRPRWFTEIKVQYLTFNFQGSDVKFFWKSANSDLLTWGKRAVFCKK